MHCLLIDDSAEVLDALRRLLESEGLVVVAQATSGADGLRHAREFEPDVILLDVDLGEENGFDVARLLSEAGVSSAVILISAHPEYGEFASSTPAVGFLSKGALSRAAIESVLSRPGGDDASAPPR